MAKKDKKTVNPLLTVNAEGQTLSQMVDGVVNNANDEKVEVSPKTPQPKANNKNSDWKKFQELLVNFTNIHEKGEAIWIPKEVKKQLELIRAKAKSNVPIRALAAAMIIVFIEKYGDDFNAL